MTDMALNNSHHDALELEIVGMSKRFEDLLALDNVSLHIPAGGFHALLGENGAGKSTLVKSLVGFYEPDAGQVLIDKREVEINSPRESSKLGIGMVYQHFTTVPSMTVAENLVMSRGTLPAIVNWREEREKLTEFMSTLPFRISLDKQAGSLAAGEKQKIEIIKQLYLQRRLLILDEPTSVLTTDEADEVLGLVRELANQKKLTALMITHKFKEVMAYADDVTVLRKGKFAGSCKVQDTTVEQLASMMVGNATIGAASVTRQKRVPSELPPRLVVEGLCAQGDNGLPVLRNVSLQVRPGEILGIAGVSGNGQMELVEVLIGQRKKSGGAVSVGGEEYSGTRAEIARHKVYSLPEEPLRNACIPGLSVAENMALRNYDQPPLSSSLLLEQGELRKQAQTYIDTFKVKTEGMDAPIQSLSGGNVQRAVLARELSRHVDLLIVANPVFGLDFGAVAETHSRLLQVRESGGAILLVSEDLDELMELADRIVVMSEGVLVFEIPADKADVREIGHYMAGGHEEAKVAA